jgi:urease accessory protein
VAAPPELGAFFAGLLHPLVTPTHALGLVALGLLIGQQATGRRLYPQIFFALALTAGLLALALAVGETPAGEVLLVAAALSGALVAAGFPLPLLVSGTLATIVGLAIGLDSPPEVISLEEAVAMLIGTGIGAPLGLAFVTAATVLMGRDWQKLGVRVLGSWTAASALLAIAVRFASG